MPGPELPLLGKCPIVGVEGGALEARWKEAGWNTGGRAMVLNGGGERAPQGT